MERGRTSMGVDGSLIDRQVSADLMELHEDLLKRGHFLTVDIDDSVDQPTLRIGRDEFVGKVAIQSYYSDEED